jgi:hypothetical protein
MNTWLRRIALIGLLLLGCIEMFYGALLGPVAIKAHEGNFANAMNSTQWSPEQSHAFFRYIAIFKDQWGIVSLFGFLTIVLALVWYSSERK